MKVRQLVRHDVNDRLTSASSTSLVRSFTFDANGTRLTQGGSASVTLTPATTSNRLLQTSASMVRTLVVGLRIACAVTVASLLPAAASASHWLVMEPGEVTQRYVDGSHQVEVRAHQAPGDKLLASLVLRVVGREVRVPTAALGRIEWPSLTTLQLRRASGDQAMRFISIECRCGGADEDEPSTAVIAFRNYRYESISIEVPRSYATGLSVAAKAGLEPPLAWIFVASMRIRRADGPGY